jgi:hypothetical protein
MVHNMAQPKQNLPVTETGFAQATEAFADGLARICRLYGVNPLLGRLYALLFVAPEPLSLDTIAQRAGTAKSTVSVALRRLLAARVVQRLPCSRNSTSGGMRTRTWSVRWRPKPTRRMRPDGRKCSDV